MSSSDSDSLAPAEAKKLKTLCKKEKKAAKKLKKAKKKMDKATKKRNADYEIEALCEHPTMLSRVALQKGMKAVDKKDAQRMVHSFVMHIE